MLLIDSVEVNGLWGEKDIKIDLKKDYNFLIGDNGTGKTTVINLIVSVLKVDLNKLWRTNFNEITIKLSDKSQKSNLDIYVRKGEDEHDYDMINYIIETLDKNEPKSFLFRNRVTQKSTMIIDEEYILRRESRRKIPDELSEILENKIKLSWLPVSRSDNNETDHDYRTNHFSSVDSRLRLFSSGFIRYASMINGRVRDNTEKFQQNVFLSLIDPGFIDKLRGDFKLDIKKEREGITDAFRTLGIKESRYKTRLEKTFGKLHSIVKEREKSSTAIEMEDVAYLLNAMRTHDFVEEYYKLKNTNELTYKPLSNFIEVLNEIFNGRKTFYISSSNELGVYGYKKKGMTLEDLSSGEKQMLIILGETLLQDEKDCIYIADEPELSLHVAWQENLVAAVTSINKNTQILFATHSPDVVGFLDEYTIDMAEVVQ